jgi:hypothetical protein
MKSYKKTYYSEIGDDPDSIDLGQPDGQKIAARAYAIIYDTLADCRATIFSILVTALNDPFNYRLTANEISKMMGNVGSGLDNNSTRTRLNELVKMQLICKDGTKTDPVSNMEVTAYRALRPGESVPRPLEHGISKKEALRQLDELATAVGSFFDKHVDLEPEFMSLLPQE